MAVPKKRKSLSKTRSRRSANMKTQAPHYQRCSNCMEPKRPHRACGSCGMYRDEEVIEIWEY